MSSYTLARQTDGQLEIAEAPVEFTHVRPGETLLREQAAAE